jgi:hypothetical protein
VSFVLVVAVGLLVGGILLAIMSASAAGDWYAPYQPIMELALLLITVGLAGTHAAGLAVIALSSSPGGWRGLAAIPAVIVGLW